MRSVRRLSWTAGLFAVLGLTVAFAAAPAASAAPAAPASVTFDNIVSFHSGKCVDVPGGQQTVGLQIQQFTCNGTVSQLWTQQFTDSGFFRLEVAVSGQCLAVKDASQAEGAAVVQLPCSSSDFSQQWTGRPVAGVSGFVNLVARHSGRALVMQSEALADRTPLIQRAIPSPDGNQSWAWQFR